MPTTATPTTSNGANAIADRAAEQVQEITRRGLDRALEVTAQLREQAAQAGQRSKAWIQDEPVKAVVVAAAAGAAVALLVRALSGSRKS
jgi:ElaB/YqjD/DUF883 family membrane-anchored ribosome-binding protein